MADIRRAGTVYFWGKGHGYIQPDRPGSSTILVVRGDVEPESALPLWRGCRVSFVILERPGNVPLAVDVHVESNWEGRR